MGKIRELFQWLRNVISHIDKKRRIAIVLFTVLLVGLFTIIFCSMPKSSTIYFDGVVDSAMFLLNSDRVTTYGIKTDKYYNGKIVFEFGKTELMYVVNAAMTEEEIQQIRQEGFPSWETSNRVFPFNDGIATLDSTSLMHLILEPPEGENFTYNMEFAQDEEGITTTGGNRIKLTGFPEDLVIKLSSTSDINMKGTAKKIPAGLYRIIGCKSITFFADLGSPRDSENGYYPQLNGSLEHFRFANPEGSSFEITYTATDKTEFSTVGHVEVEGHVQKGQWLKLEISDIGRYPIPIEISGQAEQLMMAGVSRYPNFRKLMVEWSPDLLKTLLATLMGILIGAVFAKKPDTTSGN